MVESQRKKWNLNRSSNDRDTNEKPKQAGNSKQPNQKIDWKFQQRERESARS
jgi:hypothetical protein